MTIDEVPAGTPLWLAPEGTPADEDTVPALVVEVLGSFALFLGTQKMLHEDKRQWYYPSANWEYRHIRAGNLPIPAWVIERARGEHAAKVAGVEPVDSYPSPHFETCRQLRADHIAWIDQAHAERFPDRDWLTANGRAQIAAHVEEMRTDGRSDNEPDTTGLPYLEL